jgi:hypothetical protein
MRNFRLPIADGQLKTCRPRRAGIGLVETLIALSIAAALLTATAAAIDASFKAYEVNQEQSLLMQRARLAIHRILTQIRVTAEHGPHDSSLNGNFAAGTVVTDTGIEMFDADDVLYVFCHDEDTKQLTLEVDGQHHVLLEGVEDFEVKLEPMRSPTSIKTGGGYDLLKRATILLTVKTSSATSLDNETTGNQTVTLSSSVMPRRNVW